MPEKHRITVKVGDIFESKAQTWVNTVNCVGVMGKGVALGFKKRFPEMYKDYAERCERGDVKLGRPYAYRMKGEPRRLWDEGGPQGPEVIVNFPTKDDWRAVSRLSAINAGLHHLKQHYREWGIRSIAVPPLGCGHGQLDWSVVGPTLYKGLSELDIPVELYAPYGTPAEELTPEFLARGAAEPTAVGEERRRSHLPAAHVGIAAIVERIGREPLHWPIGRIMLQKVAFFATYAGLPTGLKFKRGAYGPFAPDLKRVLTRLVNNGLLHEEKRGRMFVVEPGGTLEHALERHARELRAWTDAIERVTDLVVRMTARQAELCATVVFVVEEKGTGAGEQEVWQEVMRWKVKRKPPFDEEEVGEAVRALNMLGWVNLEFSEELPVPDAVTLDA